MARKGATAGRPPLRDRRQLEAGWAEATRAAASKAACDVNAAKESRAQSPSGAGLPTRTSSVKEMVETLVSAPENLPVFTKGAELGELAELAREISELHALKKATTSRAADVPDEPVRTPPATPPLKERESRRSMFLDEGMVSGGSVLKEGRPADRRRAAALAAAALADAVAVAEGADDADDQGGAVFTADWGTDVQHQHFNMSALPDSPPRRRSHRGLASLMPQPQPPPSSPADSPATSSLKVDFLSGIESPGPQQSGDGQVGGAKLEGADVGERTEQTRPQEVAVSPQSAVDKESRERTRLLGARLLTLSKRKPGLAKAAEAHVSRSTHRQSPPRPDFLGDL